MMDNIELTLSALELERYKRHLDLPKMGIEGQKELKSASVLVVGLGGLGSISSLYLTLAGIGTVGLVEDDQVALSNLHRQILYTTDEIDQPKLDIASEKLKQHNPDVTLNTFPLKLNQENSIEIIKDYDLVVDGTDNVKSRQVINQTCVTLQKPYVFGAVNLYDGQVSVFHSTHGPCMECVFPINGQEEREKNSEQLAVLSTLPATIAAMQATEVIKLIAGLGNPLIGELLIFNILNSNIERVALQKNPNCPICSK